MIAYKTKKILFFPFALPSSGVRAFGPQKSTHYCVKLCLVKGAVLTDSHLPSTLYYTGSLNPRRPPPALGKETPGSHRRGGRTRGQDDPGPQAALTPQRQLGGPGLAPRGHEKTCEKGLPSRPPPPLPPPQLPPPLPPRLPLLRLQRHPSLPPTTPTTPTDRRRFLPGRRLKQAVELVQTPAAALPVAPPANAAPSMFSSSSSSARSPVTSAATSIQSQTESVQCTEASPPQQRLGGQRCDKRAEPTPRRIGLELCPPPAQGQVRRVSPRQASPRTRRRRAS